MHCCQLQLNEPLHTIDSLQTCSHFAAFDCFYSLWAVYVMLIWTATGTRSIDCKLTGKHTGNDRNINCFKRTINWSFTVYIYIWCMTQFDIWFNYMKKLQVARVPGIKHMKYEGCQHSSSSWADVCDIVVVFILNLFWVFILNLYSEFYDQKNSAGSETPCFQASTVFWVW